MFTIVPGSSHVDEKAHRRKGWVLQDAHRHACEAGEVLGRLVIGVRAQLREYSRRIRRADGEHCLLLVWIALEARLLLWF